MPKFFWKKLNLADAISDCRSNALLMLSKCFSGISHSRHFITFVGVLFPFSVAAHSNKNLMAASNLGVVFGPTLMKSREETMAAIMNLKYQSIVIELLINEFKTVSWCLWCDTNSLHVYMPSLLFYLSELKGP